MHLYTCSGIKEINIEPQLVIDYLEYVISHINNYENYHIALIYQDMDKLGKDISLSITERKEVFLYFTKETGNTNFYMNDPALVKVFVDYYQYLWQKISPLNKDKKDVILVIESYINILKKAK